MKNYSTSTVSSVPSPGLDRKALKNQGDFHAEGDSRPFLKGVPPNLPSNKKTVNCNERIRTRM